MKIALIVFIIITSFTMQVPDNIKAENVVRNFLDSTYKPQKVEIIRFNGFITMQEYTDQKKQEIYKSNINYQTMSEEEKVAFRAKVEKIISSGSLANLKGSKIICTYKIKEIIHNTVFFIDTAFKNVYSTIEAK